MSTLCKGINLPGHSFYLYFVFAYSLSVLGPKNYCMYDKPVDEIIKRYNIKYHCYSDDKHVYMTLKSCDKRDDISSSIDACIADIGTWMNSNIE